MSKQVDIDLKGVVDFNDAGKFDIDFWIADPYSSLTRYALKNVDFKNLQSGGIFLEGKISTESFLLAPRFQGSFGMDSLQMEIPKIKGELRNMTVKGSFDSGTKLSL